MTGYRDNQWYLPPEENLTGIAGAGGLTPSERDNEPFLYPGVSRYQEKLGIGSQSNTSFDRQTKGFIRSLNRIAGVTNADRRFFFQFNPPALMRNLAMNTDMLNPLLLTPGELTLPVPGQANFSFEIMLDRQAEVNAGINNALRARNVNDLGGDTASAYEIGVLADINVLDKVIGVGVDPEAVEVALKRAEIQFANQASDADGDSETSAITKIEVLDEDDGKFPVKFEHATKDFVTNGQTINISGCVPVGFNVTGATVSQVSNVTPHSFVVTYDSEPGASATTLGSVVKEIAGDGEDTNSTEGFDIEQVRTRLTSLGAESNRAFLIPNPVRVVFSSLYMVDGYVTGVNLLFTKFSRNMVPVTATLAIQMEARYIGFAREKTFLTEILEQANEPNITTPTAPPALTPVNPSFRKLLVAVDSIKNDYEILLCGTDNDDNPAKWCNPLGHSYNDNYYIDDVLSFNTIVVQFGFRTAYNFRDTDADDAAQSSQPFIKFMAEGNMRSITHQIDSIVLTRDLADPSESSPVTILELGPITAPAITSYSDFIRNGALGGSGATKNSQITNVSNTILMGLIDGGMGSEDAKNLARNLYFASAIPDGQSVDEVKVYATVNVSVTFEDVDGNIVRSTGSLVKYGLNRKKNMYVKPRLSVPTTSPARDSNSPVIPPQER
jgi:hypothetical protein